MSLIKDNDHSPYLEMREYDAMPAASYPPYTLLSNTYNYSSKSINTDRYGFRKSLYQGELKDSDYFKGLESVSLVVGGSTVFGVGATSDIKTVSSLLHLSTGRAWLNLGIRGAVSIQEYISLILHITDFKKVDEIFFLSGVNDLYRNMSDSSTSVYDKRFSYQNDLLSLYSPKRITYSYLKSLFSTKSFHEILTQDNWESNEVEFKQEASLEVFEKQYLRNFILYSALAKELNCAVVFGFQPFFHCAKSKGTIRELTAIKRTERLQYNTNWDEVKDRINKNITIASNMFSDLCMKYEFQYIDYNQFFDDDVDYFVDSVHLTDDGNKKITEVYNELVYKNKKMGSEEIQEKKK